MKEAKCARGPRVDREMLAAIGFRVRERRKSLGLTQEQVSDATGCGRVMITLIEGGKSGPGASLTPSLCRALEWTPNDLFGWEACS